MKKLVTPKQVSQAIGVSESSLKRWCDRGLIPTVRTAGGHRRLPIAGVLEFLRQGDHPLARPELLGLPSNTGRTERTLQRAAEQLGEALVDGSEEIGRQIVFDLWLAGFSLSAIADEVIAPVFEEIGRGWHESDVEVYQERRAYEIGVRIVHELRGSVTDPPATGPKAIGGAPDGDLYGLATRVAELILRARGWNAVNLGSLLPFATLRTAIEETRPRLFWLSVSHIRDRERFLAEYQELYATAIRCGAAMVVGGNALDERIRAEMRYTAHCDRMHHLESFVATLEQS
jgi:excisionase family DNA binding protein